MKKTHYLKVTPNFGELEWHQKKTLCGQSTTTANWTWRLPRVTCARCVKDLAVRREQDATV